jgi:hypothetical protein
VCENVTHYEAPTISTHQPAATHRHSNWTIRNNRCENGVTRLAGVVFELPRIDGLRILDNHMPIAGTAEAIVTDTGSTGPNGPSTGVVITPAEQAQFVASA